MSLNCLRHTDGHQVQSFKRLISLQRGVTTWSSSSSLAPSFNQTPICPHSHHHPRCSTSSQPACTAQDDGLSASITLLQTPRKETCESDKKTSQHPSCPPYRPHRTNVACTVLSPSLITNFTKEEVPGVGVTVDGKGSALPEKGQERTLPFCM